jgi:hypothetical protein
MISKAYSSSNRVRVTILLFGFVALPGVSLAQWIARCPSCARHLGGSGVAGPYSSKELCQDYVARMRSQGFPFSDCEPQAGATSSRTPAAVTLPPVITHNLELDKSSLEGKAQRAAAVAARTANRKGLEALDRKDWEAAARHFDEAARLDPSEPQYRRNRERARERSARAAPAESEFFHRLQLRLTGPEEPPRRARNEVPSPEPRYRPSGNGLVFGTGAILGRSLPPDPTEALRREADRRLEEQKLLAGLSEAERRAFPATAEYGLLIGVAAYHDPLWDLVARVGWGDEFSEGKKSAEEQPLYTRASEGVNSIASTVTATEPWFVSPPCGEKT